MGIAGIPGRRYCDARVWTGAAGALGGGRHCKKPPAVKEGDKDLCVFHSSRAVKERAAKRRVRIDDWMAKQNASFEAIRKEQRRQAALDRLLPKVIELLTMVKPGETEDMHLAAEERMAAKLRRLLP